MAKMFDKYKDVLAYEAYYDDTAGGNVCSSVWKGQNPKAAAAYKLYFGAGSEFGIQ
jgi:hypothetical protein